MSVYFEAWFRNWRDDYKDTRPDETREHFEMRMRRRRARTRRRARAGSHD